jgi:hypothetical protein
MAAELPPFYYAYLELPASGASEPSAMLVLGLLRALGAGLVLVGLSMLLLLRTMRSQHKPRLGVAAAVLALGYEGTIGTQLLSVGIAFGAVPIAMAVSMCLAIGLCLVPRFGFAEATAESQ